MAGTTSKAFSLLDERLISFAQATRLIPASRQGRPVSPSCIWRWHTSGVKTVDGRTVRLEAMRLVNRFVTSEEAVRRFILAQQPDDKPNSAEISSSQHNGPSRTPDRRQRDSERALDRLQQPRTAAKGGDSSKTEV